MRTVDRLREQALRLYPLEKIYFSLLFSGIVDLAAALCGVLTVSGSNPIRGIEFKVYFNINVTGRTSGPLTGSPDARRRASTWSREAQNRGEFLGHRKDDPSKYVCS